MDLSLITVPTVITFFLMLFRVSGMFLAMPVFSGTGIPQQVKIGLSIGVLLVLFPFYATAKSYVVPKDVIQFTVLAIQELGIGFLIGFAADLLFAGVRMAGEYLSVQMGISVANVLDPQTGTQIPILSQVYAMTATILFLNLNIHHGLIVALNRSFQLIPLGHPWPSMELITTRYLDLSAHIFLVAFYLGIPVLGVLFVTEVGLAFVAKVNPQMNIFMVALPLKVILGLSLMASAMPFTLDFLSKQYAALIQQVVVLYKA